MSQKQKGSSGLKKPAQPRRRTLLNRKRVKESGKTESWRFRSKCPEKWVHIDCETGQIFVWDSDRKTYKSPSKDIIDAAFTVLCGYKFFVNSE